jgi:sulfane dehydrogenase subunit SoxC
MTRQRTVAAGRIDLLGRAWSGHAPVAGVEVSTDGGASWEPASLEPADLGPWAWRGWTYAWHAVPGMHVLCSRARDEMGNEQPLEPPWNVGGYGNNAVQRVEVTVV